MRLVGLVIVVLAIAAGVAYDAWTRSHTKQEAPQRDLPPVVAPPPPPREAEKPVATPADLGASRATVTWRMKACKNAPGCNENGIGKTCREAGVKKLRFVIENEKTGELRTTHTPCPADASQGEVVLELPKGDGPWTLSAASDDVASARTEVVCHMTKRCWQRSFSLSIYAKGCMDPECLSCLEGTHTLGWCE